MRPFSDLSEGREWFISWLAKHQFTDILDTNDVDRYCHWDVEATLNGERYAFELKNRTFPSSEFNDAAINKYKYDSLVDCPYKSVLVMFWTDRFILIDIKGCHPDGDIIRECPHQTRFPDHRPVDNRMVTWNIRNMKLLDYDQV